LRSKSKEKPPISFEISGFYGKPYPNRYSAKTLSLQGFAGFSMLFFWNILCCFFASARI